MNGKTHRNTLQPGYRLHWYEIKSVLGRGGFGITYLATDLNLDRDVAIKEYLPTELAVREGNSSVHPISSEHEYQYKWGLDRFISEAKTLARFKHSNIVPVQAVFEDNNTGYMVMQYEHGRSMQQKLSGGKTMQENELLEILMPVLDGLELVHNAGFIHRDLKPDNIFIREDGVPVLLDFGSARQALGEETRTLTSMISPGYAPYEQYYSRSNEQGPWTDIYGLGATLYRAVAGVSPISAIDRSKSILETGRDSYVSALEIGRDRYSENFLAAIDQAMRFNHSDRPRTISEWRRMFDQSGEIATVKIGLLPTEQRTVPGTEIKSRRKKYARLITLTIILLLLIAVIIINRNTLTDFDYKSLTRLIHDRDGKTVMVSEPNQDTQQIVNEQEVLKLHKIDGLLQAAEEDFNQGHLVEPEGSNALEKYSTVLQLDHGNLQAIAGRNKITSYLLQAADQAIDERLFDEAGSYLDQAASVEPDSPQIGEILARLQAEKTRQEQFDHETEIRRLEQQQQLELQKQKQELEQQKQLALQKEQHEAEQHRLALIQKQQQEETFRQEQERLRQKEYELENRAKYNRLLYEAQQAMNENDYALALSRYEQSLQLFPGSEEVLTGISRIRAIQSVCRRITGEWDWYNGGILSFHADGTVKGRHRILADNSGVWKCTEPDARRFVVRWNQGGWINYLTLSGDGNRLDGSNQEGTKVSGKRR